MSNRGTRTPQLCAASQIAFISLHSMNPEAPSAVPDYKEK
jgi:hypothetical protein